MLSSRISALFRFTGYWEVVCLWHPTALRHSSSQSASWRGLVVRRSLHQSQTFRDDEPSKSEENAKEEKDGEAAKYSKEELIAGPEMLKRIVGDLQKQGTTFILPHKDHTAINQILEPFNNLISAGVRVEFVMDACVKRPQLLRAFARQGSKSFVLIQLLVDNCSMTFEDAIRLFSSYTDEMLCVTSESVQDRLSVIVGCNISAGHSLAKAVRKCPAILFASTPQNMGLIAESLSGFFSRAQICSLVANAPHVLLSKMEELEPKYEYIYYHMCIEESEFGDCVRWVEMSLDDIIMRHQFLQKTGRYTTPDHKRPQFKMENPVLQQILDTPEGNFATEVAGVSTEEWLIFQGLTDKLKSQSDKERPFERVKPSMRKAFQRRLKQGDPKLEFIFNNQQ